MRADKRIIFPSDRDIIEERTADEYRDMLLSKTDGTDGVKTILLNDHIVKFRVVNKVLTGLVKTYDMNDNLISILQYVNNERMGLYTKYDVSGFLSCSGTYMHGKCYGTWKYYDENGDVIKSVSYD